MPKRKAPLEVVGGKPSLASLRSGVKKSTAEKNRSVKRIDAAASKKSSPLRLKQISEAFSKNGVQSKKIKLGSKNLKESNLTKKEKNHPKAHIKKIVSDEKTEKVAIGAKGTQKKHLNIRGKVVAEKVPVGSKRSPYSFFLKSNTQKINLRELEPDRVIVRLPENMSIRAREKALVILHSFIEDFKNPAEQLSLISGLCFVVLGSYLALSFSGYLPVQSRLAAQVSSSLSATTSTNLANSTNATTYNYPVLKIIDQLPKEITAPAVFTFSLTNSKNVTVRLFSLSTGNSTSISAEQLTADTFRYKIEVDKLQPGQYTVKVFSESSVTSTRFTFSLGDFSVPAPVTISNNVTASTTSGTAGTSQSSTGNTTPTTSITGGNASSTATPIKTSDYKIRLEGQGELSGQTVLKMYAPVEAKAIELYIRPAKSITSRFLGLAEKRTDAWFYFFNTTNIPNGDYELYARSRINDVFVQSNSLSTKVNNIASPVLTIETPPTIEDLENEERGDQVNDELDSVSINKTSDAAEESVRTFSENNFTEATSTFGTLKISSPDLNNIFAQYEEQLADLLKRYAVVRQSNDPKKLRIVDEEFENLKNQILHDLLQNDEKNSLADTFSLEFDNRLVSLKKRIDTFEKLRNTAGIEDIAIDSDADGISDYDERNLYRTDAHAVDTDGDGFDDGAEIVRGYDPRNPRGETAIEYEKPQDTVGLEDAELLHVDTVIPSIRELSQDNKVVQSEIRGKALPNSFVTLYIFSTPTVVTVKTDNDGSFVYTFERELEDGEHEVYAAVTDNTGAIVAHSRPFKFIKQAEAFTPVGSNEAVNTVTLADLKQFQMQQAVIGLGILALGIILLMLGFNFRNRRQEEGNAVLNDSHAT